MAKQIYIDENGNEQLVSGTINNAELLPIESGSATNTKDYIDNLTIGDLSDVDTTGASTGDILVKGASGWEDSSIDTILPTSTPTVYATKTSGAWNISSISVKQNHKTVEIEIVVGGTNTAVASGSDGFVGTISGKYPLLNCFAISYYGANIFVLRLQNDGKLTIRNVNSSSFTLPTGDSFTFGFTYLTT